MVDKFEISEEVKKQNWDIKFNNTGIFVSSPKNSTF